MRKQSSIGGVSLILAFVSSISLACAQIGSGGTEMPSGDVWPSDAEHIHFPTPGAAEADEEPPWNGSPSTNTEALHANCTARSRYERRSHVSAPRAAIIVDKHEQHLRLAHASDRGHSIRHGSPQNERLVSFRCRIDLPGSEIGTVP
jgi:hypothetical protein